MKLNKSKIIEKVIAAYLGLSIVAAFVAPLFVGSITAPDFLEAVPTVATLSGSGSIDGLWAYFIFMYALLPVAVFTLFYAYEAKEGESIESLRLCAALLFFIGAICLLAWFAFFLPPDRTYRGTRIRILIYAVSNYKFLLGIIYGAIFSCLAISVMLSAKYSLWILRSNKI